MAVDRMHDQQVTMGFLRTKNVFQKMHNKLKSCSKFLSKVKTGPECILHTVYMLLPANLIMLY